MLLFKTLIISQQESLHKMDIDDPISISGISRLVNSNNTKKGLDLGQLENSMIKSQGGEAAIDKAAAKQAQRSRYDQELDQLIKELGIDLSESADKKRTASGGDDYAGASDSTDDSDSDSNNADNSDSGDSDIADDSGDGSDSNSADSDGDSGDGSDSDNYNRSGSGSLMLQRGGSSSARSDARSSAAGSQYRNHESSMKRPTTPPSASGRGNTLNEVSSDLKYHTEEQKKQSHINNVMSKLTGEMSSGPGGVFTIEDERRNDWRVNALADIEDLKQVLEDEGEDLSRVPLTNDSSPDELIISVRNTLRYKNNRKQDSSLFEQVATSLAHGAEDIFNGEREFFGCKPDLTDWHHSVVRKLRRRRYETAEFVSAVMSEYGVSGGYRLALELFLDAFLHHKSRTAMDSNTFSKIVSSKNAIDAMNEIADAE